MKYSEQTAIATIKSGGHTVGVKAIEIKGIAGCGTWGAIDYLVKHFDYQYSINGTTVLKAMLLPKYAKLGHKIARTVK